MYKFFQDKHIKVSLFIQDGIQGLDGTIYLNFAGEGPCFSQPLGQCLIYSDKKARETSLPLLHA
jgi:hypothetical protein